MRSHNTNQIINKNYQIDIPEFLNRGWEIFRANFWNFVGFCLLSSITIYVLSQIPVLGGFLLYMIMPVVSAGYFFVAFNSRKAEFADFFNGFGSNYFFNLFWASLIAGLFIALPALIALVCFSVIGYNPLREIVSNMPEFDQISQLPELSVPNGSIPIFGIVGLLALGVATYLSIAYSFAIPLIVDRKMKPWEAIETSRRLISKKWWSFAAFSFVLSVINLLGLLTMFGTFLTSPFTNCAMAAAYEKIVGLDQPNT
jgi:uncharacterized membrane protein